MGGQRVKQEDSHRKKEKMNQRETGDQVTEEKDSHSSTECTEREETLPSNDVERLSSSSRYQSMSQSSE